MSAILPSSPLGSIHTYFNDGTIPKTALGTLHCEIMAMSDCRNYIGKFTSLGYPST